jgi:hypothetical protein
MGSAALYDPQAVGRRVTDRWFDEYAAADFEHPRVMSHLSREPHSVYRAKDFFVF